MTEQSPQAIRVEALESILQEKGLISEDDVDRVITEYQERIGPMRGARIVARAWTDPAFRALILDDGNEAIRAFDFDGVQTDQLVIVENTPKVQNCVVCTLCSCYPWAVLGLPPRWYKDPAYRSRVVREPRTVLAEMGLELEDDVEIRVWDSSAEVRYMVLPERPGGTEGLNEAELAELVSRDAMVGVARVTAGPEGENA